MNSNKNYEKIIRNLKERNREVLDRCISTNIRNLSLDYEIIKLRNQIDTYQKTLDEVTFEKMDLEDKKIIRLEFEEGNIEDKLFLARYITKNRAKINELIDEVNKLKGE